MSIDSMAVVWAHSAAPTQAALLVALGIAEADGEGGAWPGMEKLARRARISREGARKIVRKLEQLGEIRTHTNKGGGLHTPEHMRTNYYELLLECPWYCDHTREHRDLREDRHAKRRPANWEDIVAYHEQTPPTAVGDPDSGRGVPPTGVGANPPVTNTLGNSESRSEKSRGDEALFETDETLQQAARQRMVEQREAAAAKNTTPRYRPAPAPHVPRFDRSMVPEPPPPRTAADDAAVACLMETECARGHPHLIPATSTICLKCGTDARTDRRETAA